ncbi:uncharacterized protein LOC106934739 [Poecilia latipinna]|uniref:uncharacterized protein LOC106934739 n=1 Tax=Poecilia latipinna TaxID=48699 RepID=UPI00072E48D7|nr:PREDICTED: uncharacterized protein LOC106934739 [Poecilia latipinna]
MKTKVKITLLFLLLCGSCYYVFTKERRSSTEHDQSSKGVSCPRMPMTFEDVKPVITVIGRNITLRCVTNFTLLFHDILEWIKGNDDILVVKDRKVHQNIDKIRFSLAASIKGLKRRIASLNISHVKYTDSGSYCCCIRNITTVRQCINHIVVVENESFITEDSVKHVKVDPSHFPTTPSPQNETNYWLLISAPVAVVGVGVGVGVLCFIAYLLRRKCNKYVPVPTCCRKGKRKSSDSHAHELSSLSENRSSDKERRSTKEHVV